MVSIEKMDLKKNGKKPASWLGPELQKRAHSPQLAAGSFNFLSLQTEKARIKSGKSSKSCLTLETSNG
jgi:hypothetical protein